MGSKNSSAKLHGARKLSALGLPRCIATLLGSQLAVKLLYHKWYTSAAHYAVGFFQYSVAPLKTTRTWQNIRAVPY